MTNFTGGPTGREIHFIDVENLMGGPHFTAAEVADLRRAYVAVSVMAPAALVVVGASASVPALEAGYGWAGSRLEWHPGEDGAELALIAVIEGEAIAERFSRVVIGSGDGFFVPAVTRLVSLGVRVTVVSRKEALSRALCGCASDIAYLNRPARVEAA